MSLIDRFLKRKGIANYDELNDEEKKTLRELEASLIGRKLTDDDVKTFLDQELDIAIGRLTETNLSLEDQIFRKCEVRLIRKIKNFLFMPELEKQMVEKQIEGQL